MKRFRPSDVFDAVARVASSASVPDPSEDIPGSSAALLAAPAAGAERPVAPRPLRHSIRASLVEGSVTEIFSACATGAVITGWAIYLGANAAVIGFLGALPLGAQLVNLPAAWLLGTWSRKRAAIIALAISRLVFLPLVALPFLPIDTSTKLRIFVLLVAASTICGVIGNNAWVAWMGALVPARIRGRFFGRRTIFLSAAGTATTATASILLDWAAPRGETGRALSLLATVAVLAGAVSLLLLRTQHEPPSEHPPASPKLSTLERAARDPRARPYLSYQLAWNAAVAISSSFFSYHLLTNLRTGFLVIAAHGVGVAMMRIGSASLWGRAVDQVGARPVLVFCSFGISLVQTIWFLVTPDRLWPIALESMASGFLWAGHAIASTHLSIGLSPPAARPFYLAGFASAGGVGFAVSSVLAGQLAAMFPTQLTTGGVWLTNIHVLFGLSAIARFAAAIHSLRIDDPGARGGVPQLVEHLVPGMRVAIAERARAALACALSRPRTWCARPASAQRYGSAAAR